MLKSEVIKANPVLAGLTPEQITAIETLSQNDENTVISAKIGEIYGAIDKDVLEVTGVAKNGTEKTYDYVKRVAGELKTKAGSVETLTGEITSLKTEKARLEKAIADGATDKETAKKLASVTAELEQTKTQFNDLKTNFDKQEADYKDKMHLYRVNNEIQTAAAGLKFKKEFPETVTKQLLANTIDKLSKSMKHEFIDDGKGGERLVFLDEKGARMNNPENQLNPYTAGELLNKELKGMGLLDEGRKQTGAGTPPNPGGGGNEGTLDLSGARTQTEAQTLASKALMQQGLLKGSAKYQEEMDKAWTDYKVNELPVS